MGERLTDEQGLSVLVSNAQDAANFYENNPGRVGAGAIVDLYRTIAQLGKIIQLRTPPQEEDTGCTG